MGTLPEIYTELEISYFLLRRLLGVRTEGDKKGAKVGINEWTFLNSRLFNYFICKSTFKIVLCSFRYKSYQKMKY